MEKCQKGKGSWEVTNDHAHCKNTGLMVHSKKF